MNRSYTKLNIISYLLGCIISMAMIGCYPSDDESTKDTLFEKIPSSHSGIVFSNDLVSTQYHNIYTDNNFYAGGGVGLGDINNNGLLDIYLVSNQGSNRLYLNKGNFEFEDITERAGVGGSKPWSTGVSFVDINGNGLLDIYVTNSAAPNGEDRKNELFINNGDPSGDGQVPTFTERAEEFGLADSGYSIHAVFFDYDNDGDLDMYLVNNYSVQPAGSYDLENIRRGERNHDGGDRLYRNDGGIFTDVTEEAGMYSSQVSFGFGASVGDLNRNGWPDLYISNDFFERDYLYMNNGDGTFREVLEETLSSISTTSMGGDIADLDNDGYPEIFITDMLPETEARIKTITDFIDREQYQREVELGFHRKFIRNSLQYNHGDGIFSEIGRYAGVEATDWSWGALIADFDLDGRRDIFVANGFYRDVTDNDHLIRVTRPEVMNEVIRNGEINYNALVDMMPSTPVPNYLFQNQGGLKFLNRASEWGVDQPAFSHGAAYGDLNGNGVPDLVINNVNGEAFVYRNRAPELFPERSWLQIKLEGEPPNTYGVGAQVEAIARGMADGDHGSNKPYFWYAEQMLQRGFQSSVDPILHLGLGENAPTIDSLQVRWPDGRTSLLTHVETNQRLVVKQAETAEDVQSLPLRLSLQGKERGTFSLMDISGEFSQFASVEEWRHEESVFNDFESSPFLFHMRSTEGPPICTADVTGNGRTDFFVGGARDQPGTLFLQENDGRFSQTNQPTLFMDKESEDTDCIFFDATGDGTPELLVASGSSEFPAGHRALADRLYRMNENRELVRMEDALPRPQRGYYPTGVVRAADLDGNGYPDLFVGIRMIPFTPGAPLGYGIPAGGYLLKNDGTGRFEDVTDRLAPQLHPDELRTAGITAAEWGDLNGNGAPDLVVVGEWMPITVFYNRDGRLERADLEEEGLDNTHGWWQSLALADLNGNGRLDLIAGNHGLNSRFRAGPGQPVDMWAGDFNRNRKVEQIFATTTLEGGPYPVALWHNLIHQLPHLSARSTGYADYAGQTVTELFTPEEINEAYHYSAVQLASVIAWNENDHSLGRNEKSRGHFHIELLPREAQLTPIYSILPYDLDGDGVPELLLGGNLDAVQPQAGPYDAGYGILLRQDPNGRYTAIPPKKSGFFLEGDIRSIRAIESDGEAFILVGRNNKSIQVFAVR